MIGTSYDTEEHASTLIEHEHRLKADSITIFAAFYGRKLSKSAYFFNMVYLARVSAICVSVVFYKVFPFQIWVSLIATMLLLIVTLHSTDSFWVSRITRYQYAINEGTVLLTFVFSLGFSDHVRESHDRESIGLIVVGLLMANSAVNFILISLQTFTAVRKFVGRRQRKSLSTRKVRVQDYVDDEINTAQNPLQKDLSDDDIESILMPETQRILLQAPVVMNEDRVTEQERDPSADSRN